MEGTLQPHVFLPSAFHRNERKLCGHDELGPIDLTPWTEHDPFTTNGQKNEPLLESPFSTSNNEVSNKLDLDAIDKLHIDPKKTERTTVKPTRLKRTKRPVSNKVDNFKKTGGQKRRKPTKAKTNLTNTTTKKRKQTTTKTTDLKKKWFLISDWNDDEKEEPRLERAAANRPIGFHNNQPIFDTDNEPTTTRTNIPDIEYWKRFISTMRPPTSISYDIEVPLVSTKRTLVKPTDSHFYNKLTTTNRQTELQTFIPKLPDYYYRPTSDSMNRPDSFDLISVSVPSTSFTSYRRPTRPTTTPEPVLVDQDDIYYFNDRDWERVDGSEQGTDIIKYYYVDNVLHKVEPHGLYRKRPTKRYTDTVPFLKEMMELLDSHEQEKLTAAEDDEIHWIRQIDNKVEQRDFDMTLTDDDKMTKNKNKRPDKHKTLLVPLKVLTNVERKDNWVSVEAKSMTLPLPETPMLVADCDAIDEFPRPMKNFY